METQRIMWHIFGLELSPYAWSIWFGCAAGLLLFLWEAKRTGVKPAAAGWTCLLGIVLGLLCARLYYVGARFELFLELGLENFFSAVDAELAAWGSAGGAAFWGAVGGVCLGALIAGKISGEKVSRLLDALAPSAALAIAVSRFGEFSIGEGIGPEVMDERLQFFPLAVMNEWEEWNFSVFLLEGLVGLCIFVLLMTVGRKKTDGYRARMFLVLYASCQILLEALRRDNFLRWLFVRVSQVASAVVLLGLIIFAVLRWSRKPAAERMPRKTLILWCTLFILMVPLIVLLEFAVDKSPFPSVAVDYLLEALCCVGMGVSSWQIVMKN